MPRALLLFKLSLRGLKLTRSQLCDVLVRPPHPARHRSSRFKRLSMDYMAHFRLRSDSGPIFANTTTCTLV